MLIVFFAIVLLVVMIPIAALAIVLVILWLAARTLRRLFSVAREPNGPLDGRRNVRVVTPRNAEDTLGAGEPSES